MERFCPYGKCNRAVHSHHVRSEILARFQLPHRAAGNRLRRILHRGGNGTKIGHVQSFFNVQRTQLAVCSPSAVVVDAVSGVGVLLDLCQQDPRTNGVQRTGRDKVQFSRLDLHPIENFCQGLVVDPLFEFRLGHFLFQSVVQGSVGCRIYDVPHFRLAGFSLHPHGVVVIGVHLNRQVLFGIDQLDQHRHSGTVRTVGAEECGAVLVQIFPQVQPCVTAGSEHAAAVLVAGEFPAFSDLVSIAFLAEFLPQAIAAPEVVLTDSLQKNWFCHNSSFLKCL